MLAARGGVGISHSEPRFPRLFPAGIACLLSLLLLLCAGCGGSSESSRQGGVITFAPSITEVVFALGQGGRVSAVSTFCSYPPEVKELARVGAWMDPDLEKITLLAPNLIIVQGEHRKVTDLAKQNGTPLLRVDMDSIQTIHEGIEKIGEALECPEAAQALQSEITAGLDTIRHAVAGQPRPKVLVITGRKLHAMDSLYTVGGPSFLSEMVDLAGGESITKDSSQAYMEASKESVIVEAPEVIIEIHAGETLSEREQGQYVEDWDQLPTLPAVKNGRVHIVCDSYALLPGPRIALLARRFAELLHPEVEVPKP